MHGKICNCLISTDENILNKKNKNSFCNKCGCIIIKNKDGSINFTLKPKHKQSPIEINPIDLIESMKKKTTFHYPNLNNEFNISEEELKNKEEIKESIDIYLKKRNIVLVILQKLMKIFDFNDIIFYQCLFFMDYIFSHKIKEDTPEKEIIHHVIGYFLCSTKMRETDTSEPPLQSFMNIKEDILLSKKKIAYYEILCLKSINYNIYSYSAYDWLIQLIGIGIVFDCEIDKNNSIIMVNGHRHTLLNSVNKSALKMLLNLTLNDIFIKYSPMYIAFSLVLISREKLLDPKLINQNLFNKLLKLYGICFDDYKKCYEELKTILDNNIVQDEKNEHEKKENNIPKNDKEKLKKKLIKKYSVENKYSSFFTAAQKINKRISLNNSKSQKDILVNETKKYPNEDTLKIKKLINPMKICETANKTNDKNILDYEKIFEEKNQTSQKNNVLNKNNLKTINNFSIRLKKKSGRSNDSLTLINTKMNSDLESLKENKVSKDVKSSKALINIYNNSSFKMTNSQEKNLNPIKFQNRINNNKLDKTLYKLNSTKKSLFKPNPINIINKNKIYIGRNSSNVISNHSKFEEIKINNNLELRDKNNENNFFRKREKNKYHLVKGRTSSLPNKKNQSTFIRNKLN